MRSVLYLPNRSSSFCSRRNCAFWSAYEGEYGGTVEYPLNVRRSGWCSAMCQAPSPPMENLRKRMRVGSML